MHRKNRDGCGFSYASNAPLAEARGGDDPYSPPMIPARIEIPTADGKRLAGSYFAPAGSAGVALLINGATGVPRGYYDAFAAHLASRGIALLTYDYRGIGESSGIEGSIEAWGTLDQPAALDRLRQLRPDDALTLVGHSFGGQVLGLAPNIGAIRAALFIAAQHGHWRHWPARRRFRMFALWWLLIPALTSVFGYFPGHLIGTARLPAEVALHWARWGRSRHYISDRRGNPLRPHNDLVDCPIEWLSFEDDPIAPLGAVEALCAYYPKAKITRRHVKPMDFGAKAIGHFGYFRRSAPKAEWDRAADWLIRAARADAPPASD